LELIFNKFLAACRFEQAKILAGVAGCVFAVHAAVTNVLDGTEQNRVIVSSKYKMPS